MAAAGWCLMPRLLHADTAGDSVMTVNGPVNTSDLQFTLTHEHILCDFTGAANGLVKRYQPDEVFARALPFLLELKSKGCNTFIDCTPAYIGRDVHLLKRLSDATGLHIVTNTGYYGAAAEKFLPSFMFTESAAQLAARWIDEWKNGIDGSGIRPGFIKTGVDKAPLSVAQQKIIEAAAITHLATGLSIAVHTGDGEAAREQLRMLAKIGVAASARIWVHAQNEQNAQYHIEAGNAGSWVSFDGVDRNNISVYVAYLEQMKTANLLSNTLVSQDSGWYTAGEINGGNYRDYNTVCTHLVPALKEAGFTQHEIDTIFISNPAKAFTAAVRRL